MTGGDEKAYRERLARIGGLFTDIAVHADRQSRTRCPYRDARDRCTARFRCRYQRVHGAPRAGGPGAAAERDSAPACTHDERVDYRDAWER